MLIIMRIGFCGLGLIGTQRFEGVRSLQLLDPNQAIEIIGCYDPVLEDKQRVHESSLFRFASLELLIEKQPDLVFVSTPHHAVADICESLLAKGIRVHVEKPLGRNLAEAKHLCSLEGSDYSLTVGFNYRFFCGVEHLLRDIREQAFGQIISIEMTLGHGGALSDLNSWKLDPILAGGGSLLDPGVHLIDLCLQIAPDLQLEYAKSWRGFWNTGIEEEVTVAFSSKLVPSIIIKSSIVRWRSEFSLRVNGTDGYGVVKGRGRSYGTQTYVRGKRWGWSDGTSQAESEELICEDECADSFVKEISHLVNPANGSVKVATSAEGLMIMQIVDDIYSMMNDSTN
jgi:predicted dehydrogenase